MQFFIRYVLYFPAYEQNILTCLVGDSKIEVCKHFYRLATGFERKQFNGMVKFVMECNDSDRADSKFDFLINRPIFSIANGNNCTKEIKATMSVPLSRRITGKFAHSRLLKKRTHLEQILAFLDFYVPQYSDQAPDKDRVFDIKESWESVYGKYVRHCATDNSSPVQYARFCEIT